MEAPGVCILQNYQPPWWGGGVIIFEDLGIPFLANKPKQNINHLWENKKNSKEVEIYFLENIHPLEAVIAVTLSKIYAI